MYIVHADVNNFTVYCHKLYDGRRYFGITCTSTKQRWGKNGSQYHSYIGQAIKKYGWDSFEHIIIAEHLSKEEACKMEEELIAKYKSNDKKYGFNLTNGGELSFGYHHTDDTKKKISGKAKGRIPWSAGKPMPKATKIALAEVRKVKDCTRRGKPATQENIENCRKSKIPKMKPIFCVETNTVYESLREAERITGICHSSISKCCKNVAKSAGKLHWEFITREEYLNLVKLYVKKITSGAINPATGEAWRLEDVPTRWKEEVKKALENTTIKPRDGEMVEEETE